MRTWMVLALCAVAGLARADPQVWRGRFVSSDGRTHGFVLHLDVANDGSATGTYQCRSGSTLPCFARTGTVTIARGLTGGINSPRGVCVLETFGPPYQSLADGKVSGTFDWYVAGVPGGHFRMHRVH